MRELSLNIEIIRDFSTRWETKKLLNRLKKKKSLNINELYGLFKNAELSDFYGVDDSGRYNRNNRTLWARQFADLFRLSDTNERLFYLQDMIKNLTSCKKMNILDWLFESCEEVPQQTGAELFREFYKHGINNPATNNGDLSFITLVNRSDVIPPELKQEVGLPANNYQSLIKTNQ